MAWWDTGTTKFLRSSCDYLTTVNEGRKIQQSKAITT